MDKIFHTDERQYVISSSRDKINLAFYNIWTRKESFSKCNGLGLIQDLQPINTMHSTYNNYFHTWLQNGYVNSVYSDIQTPIQICNTTELDIQSYYLHS